MSVFEIFLLGAHQNAVDAFFRRWSPDEILKLRQLSSSMLFAVEAYCDRDWNINDFLARWFGHPPSFLEVLNSCDAVVSGSEAQQFFARREYLGDNLDIYVPPHGLLDMGRWLQGSGYIYQPTMHQHPLFDATVMTHSAFVGPTALGLPSFGNRTNQKRQPVFTSFYFIRPTNNSARNNFTGRRVNLFAARGDPVEFMISSFHSSESAPYHVRLVRY